MRFKRNANLWIALAAVVSGLASFGAAPASAAFGLASTEVEFREADGSATLQAGSHPFEMVTKIELNKLIEAGVRKPDGALRNLVVELPPGFAGKPTATPRCSGADFATLIYDEPPRPSCADDSAVGYITISGGLKPQPVGEPPGTASVFNLTPAPGSVAKFGFVYAGVPVTFEAQVSAAPPYRVVTLLGNTSQALLVDGAELTLWGDPANSAHDPYRGNCLIAILPDGPPLSRGECPMSVPGPPFLTVPTSCSGDLKTEFTAFAWNSSSAPSRSTAVTQGVGDCGALGFVPEVDARATTGAAESGSGLDFDLAFGDQGLVSSGGYAQSHVKKAEVILPEGMTINPSVGAGLAACTPAELARETATSDPGAGCPNASKLGTLHVETPLIDEALEGSVFLAQQDDPATTTPGAENPFDSLIAMYFVIRNPQIGVIVKMPARVDPDPRTGQIVTTVEDSPQLPFSKLHVHLRTGERAALVTPPRCGTYEVKTVLTPWARPNQPVTRTSPLQITRGVGGGPCPSGGVPPFSPGFEAGSVNNNAGSFSAFDMRLTRSDGEQDMTRFSSVLPPGVVGSLVGVAKCGDAEVQSAKSKTGREELAFPSCPGGSEIGHTLAGAGVGEALTYVPGKLYLAGSYKGAPLSVVSVTPALAGPFDAGTVVVRLGLDLNSVSAQVEVDGAASDPIPHILKGIVLKVRDLRVYVDRPNFTLNPTSCDESRVKATLFGSFLDVFSDADDVAADLSTRYQAANCLALDYNPRLSLDLKGGTKRGKFPALKATFQPRAGHANTSKIVTVLPRSAFLEQGHIRTICTRPQFAANACPEAAQYGYVKAWTPLLEEPLQGPVYLRANGGERKLPDLVLDLEGLVDVEAVGYIDSKGGGIRATFVNLPDAPITKVELSMQGGKKGLIVNSRDLCKAKSRVDAQLSGQNGKTAALKPLLKPQCPKPRKSKSKQQKSKQNKK